MAGTAVAVLWPCIPGRPKCAVRRGWQAGGVTPPRYPGPGFAPLPCPLPLHFSSAVQSCIPLRMRWSSPPLRVSPWQFPRPAMESPAMEFLGRSGLPGCGSPACKGHGAVLFRAAAGTPGWFGADACSQRPANVCRAEADDFADHGRDRQGALCINLGKAADAWPISPGHYATMPAPYTVCGASCAFEGSCTSCRCLPSGCSLPPTGSRTLPPAVCIY